MGKNWRILLVDAHTCSRIGLYQVVTDADFDVVAETDNFEELDALLQECQPHLLLLAGNLLPKPQAQFLIDLCQSFPETAVVLFLESQTDWPLMELVTSGARGLIAKTESSHTIAQTLQAVSTGNVTISPQLMARMTTPSNSPLTGTPEVALAPEEENLLQFLCVGKSNPEIAQALSLSRKTVGKRLTALYAKLGVNSRTGAVAWYLAHRWEEVSAQKRREFPPEM